MNLNSTKILYELVWRHFQRTLVHEVSFTFSEDQLAKNFRVVLSRNGRFRYFNAEYENYWRYGFPLPEQGGIPFRWGESSRLRIFMDDVFLCPECGALHRGATKTQMEDFIEIPWLDYTRTKIIDKEAMFGEIKQRKNEKEFGVRRCEDRSCCEYFVKNAKEIYDRKNREMELFVRSKGSPSVYLIGSSSFVKIGIATNVQNRLAALQTSSPHPLKIIKAWNCKDAKRKEKLLHEKYKEFRKSGEWFYLPEAVVKQLLTAKSLDSFLENHC